MWQIWGEKTTGEQYTPSGRNPPTAIGSGVSWGTRKSTGVVPAAQWGSWGLKWGLCPSAVVPAWCEARAALARATLRGGPPCSTPCAPHSIAALQTPPGTGAGIAPQGQSGEVRESGVWEENFPLLPAWRTGSQEEESVSPSLSLGHHGDTSQHLLAPSSLGLLAGSGCWEREEGGRKLVPNPTWMAGFWQACWAFSPSNFPLFPPSP